MHAQRQVQSQPGETDSKPRTSLTGLSHLAPYHSLWIVQPDRWRFAGAAVAATFHLASWVLYRSDIDSTEDANRMNVPISGIFFLICVAVCVAIGWQGSRRKKQ